MGTSAEVESQLALCERCRDMLRALVRIHLQDIEPPTRKIEADDPDWIGRLRKVCLHVLAIDRWEIDIEAVHAMATEIRAAYVQVDAVWKCLPEEFQLDEMDSDWWASEARSGLLATYDHPTVISLCFPAWQGGFGGINDHHLYTRLAIWLSQLGLGYGLALNYLAEVLGAKEDIASRVNEALSMPLVGKDE